MGELKRLRIAWTENEITPYTAADDTVVVENHTIKVNTDEIATKDDLDAGNIAYDDTETYSAGTVGKGLSSLKAEINHLSNNKADIIISNASGTVASFTDGAEYDAVGLTAEFAPYQEGSGDASPENVRPIHGWTGMQVMRTEENVWDEEWEIGALVITTGAETADLGCFRSKNYIPLIPGATYFACGTELRFCFYDADKNFVESPSSFTNTTFTVPLNAAYGRFYRRVSPPVYNHDISINYPSTNTEYRAYTGAAYHISWQTEAGEVFGGYVDVVRGKLTVDMLSVDLGTINWINDNQALSGMFSIRSNQWTNIAKPKYHGNLLCTQYVGSKVNWRNLQDLHVTVDNSIESPIFRVRDERYNGYTAEQFKTAMSGVVAVYELATPIEYDIDPVTIELLKGYNNVWNSTGGNNEVQYKADTKLYIDGKQIDIRNTIAPIEDGATASQAYAIGKYFYRNGSFCKAKTAIASGAAFTLGTNYEVTTVSAELFTALS